jgi:Nif-specific regulatory protein
MNQKIKQNIDEEHINQIRSLADICSREKLNIEELIEATLQIILKTSNARYGSILLYYNEELKFYFGTGGQSDALKDFVVPLDKSIAGKVFNEKKPLIVDDVNREPIWFKKITESMNLKIKTILAIPLINHDICLGVLELLDKKDGTYFNKEDIEMCMSLVEIMTKCMNSLKLYKSLKTQINTSNKRYVDYGEIVGSSMVLQKSIDLALKAGKTDTPILINGETGTGKELIARLIHDEGNRKNEIFVDVNCGAFTESVLESELFGHEKGSFTGASNLKCGLFELADNGTLFLDELGEMPLHIQVKLLRVIQEGTFRRVGGTNNIKTNVRIISATNKNLDDMVEKKKFREDLFYRLNVVKIKIPALRDRIEDIPLLVKFFLEKQERKGLNLKVQDEVIELLKTHNWPGNIRELFNCLERSFFLSEDNIIKPCDIDIGKPKTKDIFSEMSWKDANLKFRREYIQNILISTNGNRSAAAEILKVHKPYLSKLLKDLNLSE